jgi:peroxiredoxin
MVNGQSCPTLRIGQSDGEMTVTIDPKTQLLRRVEIDMTKGFLRQGARTVKSAELMIDYTTIEPDAELTAEAFAWTPPPGSRESHEANDATALVGKAPPAFRLKALDGTTVASTALRGKVAVLNFFATWCGPCVGEMPELDKMYRQYASQGLCWYEIDEGESAQQVRSFIASKGLSLPVLLDDSSVAGTAYGVLGIPQTVIVGADGRVRKVIVGADPDSIRREIDAAVAAGR